VNLPTIQASRRRQRDYQQGAYARHAGALLEAKTAGAFTPARPHGTRDFNEGWDRGPYLMPLGDDPAFTGGGR
jgi:hypothetical protein